MTIREDVGKAIYGHEPWTTLMRLHETAPPWGRTVSVPVPWDELNEEFDDDTAREHYREKADLAIEAMKGVI